MKSTFKILLSLTVLSLASLVTVRAEDTTAPTEPTQPGRGKRPDPAKMEERAAKELGLTADQETKWKDIGERQRAALNAIKDDVSLTRRERRHKAADTMKQFRAERRGILTADQQQKFDSLQKEMMEKMRENRKGRAAGDQPPGN